MIFLFDYSDLRVYTYKKVKMNKIKVSDNEISLTYEDRKETWLKTSSSNHTSFIKYNGYTYILKSIK